jgi:hypothetical protein
MTPLEFLAVVLPSPTTGVYCAAGFSKNKKKHVYVNALEEITPAVEGWVEAQQDVYFALATFETAGKRTAENARFIKSLFIDMDGYASKKQAALALGAFLADTGLDALGAPWIVFSGGGLHCYWPLTEDIDVAVWKPTAENLKRLCKQQKLNIDMTVTADAARVLRIPDTFNFKKNDDGSWKYGEPKQVKLLAEGDRFDFDTISQAIAAKLTTIAPVSATSALGLPGKRPDAAPAVPATMAGAKLFENSTTKFGTIYLKTKKGIGCAQLKHFVENAEDDGMEPLWRGWLSIAQKCSDGDRAAVWLSELHPYDEVRMREKQAQIKGPYPCVKFESENPGVCDGCQHFGKITNPLALGREIAVETEEKEIEIVIPSESPSIAPEVKKLLRPTPPRGFGYGSKGGVFSEKSMEDADGNTSKKQVMLLPYDLFVVDILNTNGDHTVHMLALRPEGPATITIPQRAVVSRDETVKSLAQQNIIAAFGAGNDKNLFEYVRACVEQASTGKAAVKVPSNYGWQEDDTYVFAGKIYSKTAAPVSVPMAGLENIVANTKPTGTIEAWRAFINLLIHKKMYAHLAVMLAGAGAPLMRFTGIYGMTYHCGSTESGTGKTLALEAAASVWGHPTHYRTGKGTSPVAMQQRLGLLNSNPLITDEITSKNRNNFEWFPEFLLDMTEGRGKERMESGSNKERLNLSTWMTVAIMSSNTHAVDMLTGGRNHASEGELRRLLEFIMDQPLKWEPHEIEIVKSLQHNYAVAGHMLVEYMAKNVEMLKTLVPEIVSNMYKEFDATNDERFWMAGIAELVGAGILLSKEHAGVVDIPMGKIIEFLHGIVTGMRNNIKGNARSAEDVLNAYTREHYGHFIVIRHIEGNRVLAELGNGKEVDDSTTRSRIMGRIEHGTTPGYIDYFIEQSMLKACCANMSFGYADFKRQLGDMFKVTEISKKDMTAKTRGPQMRVAVLKISRLVTEKDHELLNSVPVGQD